MMEYRRLNSGDASLWSIKVAQLHCQNIPGALPEFGEKFLARLYFAMGQTPYSEVWIAVEGSTLLGFVSGATQVGRMYLWIIATAGPGLLLSLVPKLFSARLLRRFCSLLLYPLQPGADLQARSSRPSAELLSIAVSEKVRAQGVGRGLVRKLEESLLEKGASAYQVSTDERNQPANDFYRRLEFELSGQKPHHDFKLNIYCKRLDRAQISKPPR